MRGVLACLALVCASLLGLARPVSAGNDLAAIQSLALPCDQRGGGNEVAASPDGRHVYVASTVGDVGSTALYGNRIFIEERDTLTGALTPVGSIAVNELTDSANELRLSPDGANVYAVGYGYGALVYVYARDTVSGGLSLLETHQDGTGGESMLAYANDIAFSADGAHAYVVSQEGITVYARSSLTGGLTLVEELPLQYSGGVAVSPDGNHVYVAHGTLVGAGEVVIYSRNGTSGALTLAGTATGVNRAGPLTASTDGASVYLNYRSDWSTGRLVTFARNVGTGLLTLLDEDQGTDPGVTGFAVGGDIALDPGDSQLYVASPGAVVVFTRSGVDGSLSYLETRLDDTAGIDGLANAHDVDLSPDGTNVYTVGEGTVTFDRDSGTGSLTFVDDAESEGGAHTLLASPDGGHVYRFCSRAVRTLERDGVTGLLTSTDNLRTTGGIPVMSPDGSHVYMVRSSAPNGVAGSTGITVLSRNAITGALAEIAVYESGVGGVPLLEGVTGVAISPDGASLYLSRYDLYVTGDSELIVFARDAGAGLLSLVQVLQESPGGADGIDRNSSIAVSPDGAHVYVGSFQATFGPEGTNDGIAIFERNPVDGSLTFVMLETVSGGGGGVLEGITELALSPDGTSLYALSSAYSDEAIATYTRDATTGLLALGSTLRNGVGSVADFNTPNALIVRPDGAYMYVHAESDAGPWSVTVLRRAGDTGALGYAGPASGAELPHRIFVARPMAASPDSRQMYALSPGGLVLTLAEAPVCSSTLLATCDVATSSAAKLIEKLGPRDLFSWKWSGPGPIELGDPLGTTDFAICLYDSSANAQPLLSAVATAGGTCGTKPCWLAAPTGYKFADKDRTPDGLTKVKLTTGTTGKAKLVVKGKGATLPPLGLPFVTPVVVQLQASNGECWESAYATPTLSDAAQFKASE